MFLATSIKFHPTVSKPHRDILSHPLKSTTAAAST
ncbi:hypothetical protein A2U01_0115794, partial [Trifolium medium]|nr:hypothetical protein [Trifolium medium]